MKSRKKIFASFRLKQNVFLPIIGLFSLIWFLFRVLPKPSRAMYPCQRVAFPLASGFVLWLTGIVSSIFFFKHLKKQLRHGRLLYACIAVVLLSAALGFTFLQTPSLPAFADDAPFAPTDPPNTPIGEAKGIFPGRVVWAHNPDATSWNGSGYWSSDAYTNQTAVSDMLSQALRDLTETDTDAAAWDALFRYFNRQHNNGDVGYKAGEKIAIKINLNACNSHGGNRNAFFSSPQGVFAMLRQLVEHAGVDAADVTFFDATRLVPREIYDKCKDTYPSVNFADWDGGNGRFQVQRDMSNQVKFSQDLDMEPGGGNPTYIPACVSKAKYLINMGQLKGHNLAGVTLNGKNLFGSIISYTTDNVRNSSAPKNAGLHPYVCVHSDFHFGGHWDFDKRAMETFNVLVDLMGHKDLGAKTMLFFVDGLYSAPNQSTELKREHKWKSFGSDWPSSIFVSQDFVAIESVCLDFLRNEPRQDWVRGNVDNYLHEAALAHDAPSGTVYDPEQDGTPLKSLGVHEHWNNATDKQYSRNLGTGKGIELFKAGSRTLVEQATIEHPTRIALLNNYPNPFNAQTRLAFSIPAPSKIRLDIYNLKGERIITLANSQYDAGTHHFLWNGTDFYGQPLASGIYLARLQTDTEFVTHKITLSK